MSPQKSLSSKPVIGHFDEKTEFEKTEFLKTSLTSAINTGLNDNPTLK